MGIAAGQGKSLLVIGAAGGVGSILVQIARRLTGLTVIGTTSRPETTQWVRGLGAHHVIDHTKPFAEQLKAAGVDQIDYAASLTHTLQHWSSIVEVMKPQGKIALIDDPAEPLNIMALKGKSLSLHWELMFTRSLFQTPDIEEQGRLLDRVAQLVDSGALKTTLAETFSPINAAMLKRAHELVESGRSRGKVVVAGF